MYRGGEAYSASSLLSPERREAYAAEVRADYAKISAAHCRAQADKKRLKLGDAEQADRDDDHGHHDLDEREAARANRGACAVA